MCDPDVIVAIDRDADDAPTPVLGSGFGQPGSTSRSEEALRASLFARSRRL